MIALPCDMSHERGFIIEQIREQGHRILPGQ